MSDVCQLGTLIFFKKIFIIIIFIILLDVDYFTFGSDYTEG